MSILLIDSQLIDMVIYFFCIICVIILYLIVPELFIVENINLLVYFFTVFPHLNGIEDLHLTISTFFDVRKNNHIWLLFLQECLPQV